MAAGKWIGGILGFISNGPLGALAGVALGALFDYGLRAVNTGEDKREQEDDWHGNGWNAGSYNGGKGRAYSGAYSQSANFNEGQRNSFLFSFLVLTSYVIRADGRVMHSEMEFVRSFLRTNFGEAAVQQGNAILLRLFDEQKRMETQRAGSFRMAIQQSCWQIAANLDYGQRLQLVDFLVRLSRADGLIAEAEIEAIRYVAQCMSMTDSDVESLLHVQGDTLADAYATLGVSPQASDDEVRKAYRTLALKHHPDRVATLGEDIRRAAEKKLQEINAAKDRIYKARGM